MPKTAQPDPDQPDAAALEAAVQKVTASMIEEANETLRELDAASDAPKLPDHKDELVAVAIERGIPSFEAWAMTVPDLTKRLES